MPLVTVIVPNFNRAELLAKAIRSVQAQTVTDWELLVCDDGSTDHSEQLVARLGEPRVRWLPGPHGGRPAIPRNRGIKHATGTWLAFLDNDDEWHPKKLSRQLERLNADQMRASCTEARRWVPEKGEDGFQVQYSGARVRFTDLLYCNRVVCSSAIFHRSLLSHVSGFPEAAPLKACEDYALWLRIATLTDFSYVNEPLVEYRDDAANSVRANSPPVARILRNVYTDFLLWNVRHPSARRILPAARVTRKLARIWAES